MACLLVASDKTTTDHFASMVSKKDCAMWRVVRSQRSLHASARATRIPTRSNYTEPPRMVAEDGVHYAPPLRAAPDAPADELGRRGLQARAAAGSRQRRPRR